LLQRDLGALEFDRAPFARCVTMCDIAISTLNDPHVAWYPSFNWIGLAARLRCALAHSMPFAFWPSCFDQLGGEAMEPFVGQIILVGFNFAPYGWFQCQGQLVPIANYQALYALIGTIYGGDGQSTFALPDLRGRSPAHQGQQTGGSNYVIGQPVGVEQVTLLSNQIGAHNHLFKVSSKAANLTTPANNTAVGVSSSGTGIHVFGSNSPNTNMSPIAIGASGSSLPHENRQPYLAFNYIIAWAGVYPSQN
jgi:microcystin-dependent protein